MRWLSRRLATVDPDAAGEVVYVGPYDQLIVQLEYQVTKETMERLRSQLNDQSDARIIVLENGLKLVGVRQKPDSDKPIARRPYPVEFT